MTEPTNQPGLLRAILDGLAGAVFAGNREGVLVEANRRACELLGYAREELVGKPCALVSTSPEREDVILMRDPFEG